MRHLARGKAGRGAVLILPVAAHPGTAGGEGRGSFWGGYFVACHGAESEQAPVELGREVRPGAAVENTYPGTGPGVRCAPMYHGARLTAKARLAFLQEGGHCLAWVGTAKRNAELVDAQLDRAIH